MRHIEASQSREEFQLRLQIGAGDSSLPRSETTASTAGRASWEMLQRLGHVDPFACCFLYKAWKRPLLETEHFLAASEKFRG